MPKSSRRLSAALSALILFLAPSGAFSAEPSAAPKAVPPPIPADHPVERRDRNGALQHEQLVAKAHHGCIDVYLLGDSITRRWGATDYPQFLAHWNQTFHGWNAADFGIGGDTTQNILWRIRNGEFDGVYPKVIVLLAGTNNVGHKPRPGLAEDVSNGIRAILDFLRSKAPDATIVLTAIFPRNDTDEANPVIDQINRKIATFADGRKVRWVNINDQLADEEGRLHEGMMVDKLHPALKGYQIWADALVPILTEVLGPRAKTDCAPPPTGDPSVTK